MISAVRPRVSDLVFQLYGRALHPELFEVCESRTVCRGAYQVKIDITSAGHVITWRYGGLTWTEVATTAQQPLPQKRRLISHRIKGTHSDRVDGRGGSNYQVNFQLEPFEPELFLRIQQDLGNDADRRGMLHRFDTSGRMSLGAISYINVETRTNSLLVQAYHTFPDDNAVVKSQSLFQTPK